MCFWCDVVGKVIQNPFFSACWLRNTAQPELFNSAKHQLNGSIFAVLWIPAFAGMTLEGAVFGGEKLLEETAAIFHQAQALFRTGVIPTCAGVAGGWLKKGERNKLFLALFMVYISMNLH